MPASSTTLLTPDPALETRVGADLVARPAERGTRPSGQSEAARTAELHADILLVRRTLAGDHAAFAALVEKYKDPVYSVAYRMMGNPTEAEDVAQDAFVRAYTQLHAYSESHRFSTWLLSITTHLAIDQIRRRRFMAMPLEKVPFLEWITDAGPGPEHATLERETSDEMQRILDKLPPKYRVVLVLRYWYDLSYDETAEALRLSPALVKARLHRARVLVERAVRSRAIEIPVAPAPSGVSGMHSWMASRTKIGR